MTTPDTLEAASRYVASGYRVLPIKPGEKRPPMSEWTKAATTDPNTVVDWFAPDGVYADHGIGLALGWQDTPYGQRCVFAVDLDEHDPDQSGALAWANLCGEHGDPGDTVCAATGGGGMHFLFACETHVRNGKIAPGVDVRGDGGQIVVAPTIHPSGKPYHWIKDHAPWEHELVDAPDWLIELVTEPERPTPPKQRINIPTTATGRIDTELGPADILRQHWNWQDRLTSEGWTFSHAEGNDEHWTRPGKNVRAGTSAVLHTDTGVLVLFSTDASVHALHSAGSTNPDGSVTLTPFHFFAATRHGGDQSAAASVIRRKHNADQAARAAQAAPTSQLGAAVTEHHDGRITLSHDDEEEAASDPRDDLGLIDWDEAFGNHAPEVPLIDGLIFPGRWTAFVSPAKAGKSTLMLHIAHRLARGISPWDASVMHADGPMNVLYLDAEMGRLDMVGRLLALGLAASDLDNLAYTDLPHKFDQIETASWLHRAANLIQPSIVILDGINGFVTGAEKDDTPWRMLYEFAIAPLKRAGIAVISTDNTGKDEQLGARGSTVKTDKADAIFTLRAGRDEHMNFTTHIARKHARTTAFTDSLTLQLEGVGNGQIEYILPGSRKSKPMIVTRDDVLKVCRTLTGLGVPDNASIAEAAKELRAEGFTIRSTLVASAVEYRREGHPVDMEGEHLTTQSASQLVNELEAGTDDDEDENIW